jgi:hypothetical protein
MGVFSIASSNPLPNDAIGASGAIEAANAAFDKNDLLELDMLIDLFF